MLSKELIKEYNKTRNNTDKSVICHAPFVNINFEQNGNMTACCYNRSHVLGVYPQNSIAEAWSGKKAEELREYIRNNDLGGGCRACGELIESRNFLGSKTLGYDLYAQPEGFTGKLSNLFSGSNGSAKKTAAYPKTFEFEISNTCNLECEMCNGYFSSSIRKNREKKPPLPNPYDDKFIEEVATFMPHLTEMKFLGGEPFLIDIYHKIWDKVLEINPAIRVHITTNGTVMNQRVRDLINKLNCNITVSIDSLEPSNYERIRAGAKFSRVIENIEEFIRVSKEKKRLFSLAICPMTLNWKELPEFVRFANARDIDTHYNTVWSPDYLSLRFFKPKELRNAIAFLENQQFENTTLRQRMNIERYREVINTFKYWLSEVIAANMKNIHLKIDEKKLLSLIPESGLSRSIVLLVLKEQMDIPGYDKYPLFEKIVDNEQKTMSTHDEPLDVSLQKLLAQYGTKDFMLSYYDALCSLQKIYLSDKYEPKMFGEKINALRNHFGQMNEEGQSTVVEMTLKNHPLNQISPIAELALDFMISIMEKNLRHQ
jgi:MoaA/NifB/PqqE/SkfB family radical SAM enzyme